MTILTALLLIIRTSEVPRYLKCCYFYVLAFLQISCTKEVVEPAPSKIGGQSSSSSRPVDQGPEAETGPLRGICEQLVECTLSERPERLTEIKGKYRSGGSCWSTAGVEDEDCETECRAVMKAIRDADYHENQRIVEACSECETNSDCTNYGGGRCYAKSECSLGRCGNDIFESPEQCEPGYLERCTGNLRAALGMSPGCRVDLPRGQFCRVDGDNVFNQGILPSAYCSKNGEGSETWSACVKNSECSPGHVCEWGVGCPIDEFDGFSRCCLKVCSPARGLLHVR